MIVDKFIIVSTGWVAIATGITGLLAFVFIVLFFSVGQPFGTINDVFIGLTAILSVVLVVMLFPWHLAQLPFFSSLGLSLAILGAILVVIGSLLSILGITGYYLSGLYMAAGNALIGAWLLLLSYAALRENLIPQGLVIFGFISGFILLLGLAVFPALLKGTDTSEYVFTAFNAIWWTASLGYLVLFPLWSLLAGRSLLLK